MWAADGRDARCAFRVWSSVRPHSSPEALEFCQRKTRAGVEVRLGGLPNCLPQECSWDLVTAFDVIEHVEEDVLALRNIHELVSPGGAFICTVPAFRQLWGPHDDLNHHKRRYTRALLKKSLESAGFHVQRMTYFNSWLFPVIAGIRLARRVMPGTRQPSSDFSMSPGWANEGLARLFASEAGLVCRVSIPFGCSLLAICQS